MIKRLILLSLLSLSGNIFADIYSDYEQDRYQKEMLKQQREQNRLMQEQNALRQQELYDQQLYNDNLQRQRNGY